VYDFHTTEQQIEDGTAPYVEVTDSALKYKITAPFTGRARVEIRGGVNDSERLYRDVWRDFSGSVLEGSIDFAGKNFTKEDITSIRVDLRPSATDLPDGSQQRYRWRFSILSAGAVAERAERINNYGLTARVEGNKITVTGSVEKEASDTLYLGDILGMVIDWKANLTVTGGFRPPEGDPEMPARDSFEMIYFSNGEFKLTDGTIQLLATNENRVSAIVGDGQPRVTLAGGTVKGDGAANTGIDVESGTLIIESGKIDIPRGNAIFAKKLTVNDSSAINGLAMVTEDLNSPAEIRAYGHAIILTDTDITYSEDSDYYPPSVTFIAGNGATLDFDAISSDSRNAPLTTTLRVETGGTVNLKNETVLAFKGSLDVQKGANLTIEDGSSLIVVGESVINGAGSSGGASVLAADPNNGVLDNSGTFTIPANSKLTNNGIINNTATGEIDNKGTIDNKGAINNKGTVDNKGKIESEGTVDNTGGTIESEDGEFTSVQTEKDIGGDIEGDVKPLETETPSSSSSGCDAGYGLFALLLAVFAAGKYRKA
jgi:hypothetical protein